MIKIGNIELEHPIMNAAGINCKTLEEVEELCKTPVTAIVVGSITKELREGNIEGQNFAIAPDYSYSVNSLGLSNPGFCYYACNLYRMQELAHKVEKPLIVSVAGFTTDEYRDLAEDAFKYGADFVELNLGCPNIWEERKGQKEIFAFNTEKIEEILWHKCAFVPDGRIAIKLSPYSDPWQLQEVGLMVAKLAGAGRNKKLAAIVTTNTFPNVYCNEAIGVTDGYAGLCGKVLKEIGLGQVRQFSQILQDTDISIIGVGGIYTGGDVQDYLDAGARAVQIGTAHAIWGPKIFDRVLTEWVNL